MRNPILSFFKNGDFVSCSTTTRAASSVDEREDRKEGVGKATAFIDGNNTDDISTTIKDRQPSSDVNGNDDNDPNTSMNRPLASRIENSISRSINFRSDDAVSAWSE